MATSEMTEAEVRGKSEEELRALESYLWNMVASTSKAMSQWVVIWNELERRQDAALASPTESGRDHIGDPAEMIRPTTPASEEAGT